MSKEALTKTQNARIENKGFESLKKLTAAPEVKDLAKNIWLGATGPENPASYHSCLRLTNEGLILESGYRGSSNPDRAVEPTRELVREFDLKEKDINDLLLKLKT